MPFLDHRIVVAAPAMAGLVQRLRIGSLHLAAYVAARRRPKSGMGRGNRRVFLGSSGRRGLARIF